MIEAKVTRRETLVRFGGLLGALLGAGGWKLSDSASAGRAAVASGAVSCVLTPEQTTCKPVKGAAVDIWHADALGVYSGFGRGLGNRTFLRGIQRTDANGLARFRSVYPGWYRQAFDAEPAQERQRLRRPNHDGRRRLVAEGWRRGLEPPTTGTTTRGSTN